MGRLGIARKHESARNLSGHRRSVESLIRGFAMQRGNTALNAAISTANVSPCSTELSGTLALKLSCLVLGAYSKERIGAAGGCCGNLE